MKKAKKFHMPLPPGPSECIGTPYFMTTKSTLQLAKIQSTATALADYPVSIQQNEAISLSLESSGNTQTLDARYQRSLLQMIWYTSLNMQARFTPDSKTGKPYWVHDTLSRIWGSTLVVDGVYIGTEDGEVVIFEAGKEKKLLNTLDMGAPVYSSPVFSNGTLYIATQTHLYAIGE